MAGSSAAILTATVVLALGGGTLYRFSSHFRPNSTLTILPPEGLPDGGELIISLSPGHVAGGSGHNSASESSPNSLDDSESGPRPQSSGGPADLSFRPTVVDGRPGYVYGGIQATAASSASEDSSTTLKPRRRRRTTTTTTRRTTTTAAPSTTNEEFYDDEEEDEYGDYDSDSDELLENNVADEPSVATSAGPAAAAAGFEESENTVRTEAGIVRGSKETYLGRSIYRFLGVPYADPPRRFERSVPAKWWQGVREATKWTPLCYQDLKRTRTMALELHWATEEMSEDCLYLNVWTPSLGRDRDPKAVLFVIHGGTFHFGGPQLDDYEGGNLASHGDIVVVTVAYRLGPFGFFDAHLPNLSGNMAVYDLKLALEWTRRNVKSFGGNPEAITLFGHNTGSIAVSIFLMSREFRPLFRRAIVASGVATSYIDSYYTISGKSSQMLARLAGCSRPARGVTLSTKPKAVADCLADLPLERIWAANLRRMELNPFCWGISLPDTFFPYAESAELLDSREAFMAATEGGEGDSDGDPPKEILIGNTQCEGVMGLEYLVPGLFRRNLTGLRAGALKIAQQITDFGFSATSLETTLNFLFRRTKRPRVILEAMAEVMTDNAFICPSANFAEKLAAYNTTVYYYLFTHKSSRSRTPAWANGTFFEEIPFMFGRPLSSGHHGGRPPADWSYRPDELELAKDMMGLISGFVRNGKPNRIGGAEWPRYTPATKLYVDLNGRHNGELVTGRGPNEESCLTWKETLKILTKLEEAGALDSLLGST